MNSPVFTQDNLLSTVITPLGDNQLLFKNLQGQEYLSELFHFQVEMLSERQNLDFNKVVGKPLTVKIQFAPENTRYINGIVTHFAQAGSDVRLTTYRAEIRPWLWLLTLTKNSQIFQNLSVPGIIKQVFDQLGFTDYRMELIHSYEERVYCVQYEETAFHFVSRLMEDEGIFYFFEHTDTQHILVLADDLGAHQPCPGIDTARFWTQNTQELTQPEDVVTVCDLVGQVTTGKYAVDDFNFETPTADLKTIRSGEGSSMRIYEYSAGFEKIGQGEKKVRSRLEAYTANLKLIEGQSHCFSFVSGYQFTLTRHPRSDLNIAYVLRWVSHSLSLTHYSNNFQAAPLEVPFRPPLVTPKPKIVSTQTAIVTGPTGEEIWTDKYGRIKVQFHWDQEGKYDENSSCWIRVNQGWAGKSWGHLAIPRIGQEVIVSFLEGDPDRPLVTGAVYNALQTVPYPLPSEQTKSSLKSNSSKGGEGFNEIRLEDKKGQEQIFIHAERNQDIRVKANTFESIGANRHLTVGHDQLEKVAADKHLTVDGDQFEQIKGDSHLIVGSDQDNSDLIESIKKDHHFTSKNQFVKIEEDAHLSIGKAYNLKVVGKFSLDAGSIHQKVGNYGISAKNVGINAEGNLKIIASGKLTLQVGGSFITLSAAGVDISGPIININSGGSPGEGATSDPTPPTAPNPPNAPKSPSPADGAKTGQKSVGQYRVTPNESSRPQPTQTSLAGTTATNPMVGALKEAAQYGTPLCETCP